MTVRRPPALTLTLPHYYLWGRVGWGTIEHYDSSPFTFQTQTE